MENHPIPQDITGFQFKLIGNMTVKQFGYLAAGVILAWICYILPLSLVVRAPLILIFVSLGLSFAFVPVDGRPMDTMFINLIKALFSPTQYIYQKEGGSQLKSSYTPQAPSLQSIQQQIIQPVQPVANTYVPPPSDHREQELINQTPAEEPTPMEGGGQKVHEVLAETVRQKEQLEKELAELKAKLEQGMIEEPITQVTTTSPSKAKQMPDLAKPAIPLPTPSDEPPNLLKGVVKDPRGNPLQNILIEVLDGQENPVRAFKTNEKGVFASGTSLVSGNYTVKLEDPKEEHKFDPLLIEVDGGILAPLEISSIDSREELRRQLFTN